MAHPVTSARSPRRSSDGPPPLTTAYHHARAHLAAAVGLLLAWEIVGIEVGEVPLGGVKLKLKTPETVPYVLLAFVFFAVLRTVVEWFQCDRERRSDRYARIDFAVSIALAAFAVAVYIAQRVQHSQIFANFSAQRVMTLAAALLAGYMVVALMRWRAAPYYFSLTLTTAIIFRLYYEVEYAQSSEPLISIGVATGIIFALMARRWTRPITWVRWRNDIAWRLARVTIDEGEQVLRDILLSEVPVIICCWHRHLVFSAFFVRDTFLRSGQRVAIRVTSGAHGRMANEFFRQVGLNTIPVMRAPDGEGASADSHEKMLEALCNRRLTLLWFPDGPRGPDGYVKDEVLQLAAESHALVLPIGFSASAIRERGADKSPVAFSSIVIAIGGPMQIANATPVRGQYERWRVELADTLNALDRRAAQAVAANSE
jgi:lysophospholipid acyltransferase (LPLAT)-like uncharacterized protein